MQDVTIGLLFGAAFCAVLCNGFWLIVTALLLFWKKVTPSRIQLIDIVEEDNALWVRQKHELWQNKNQFLHPGNTAETNVVYKSSWFLGKSDPIDIDKGDYLVLNGKLLKNTVILKGTKALKDWSIRRIEELQYKMAQVQAEKMSLVYEIERLKNNYNIDVDKRIQFEIDQMVKVAPFMTKGQKK